MDKIVGVAKPFWAKFMEKFRKKDDRPVTDLAHGLRAAHELFRSPDVQKEWGLKCIRDFRLETHSGPRRGELSRGRAAAGGARYSCDRMTW